MNRNTIITKATTGLTGAVALAGATQAYGAVVRTPTLPANLTATATTGELTSVWDVDGDGTNDFVFGAGGANIGGAKYLGYTGVTAYSGGVVGYTITGTNANYYYATALAKGTTINASSTLEQGSYLTNLFVKYGTYQAGQFTNGKSSYLGFSFNEADGTHYGYIQLTSTVTSTAKPGTSGGRLTFTSAYYNTTAGAPITVGMTGAVPEPGSLAALAAGAAGLAGAAAYRRKKAAAVA